MHHKKEVHVGFEENQFTFIWRVDLTRRDLDQTTENRSDSRNCRETRQPDGHDMRTLTLRQPVSGTRCACHCVAACEVVLCVSVITGSESSKQAGAVEKRPPGSRALSSHYREGRPDNNGDIMRARDRLSFSKWETGRVCSVPSQRAHSH